MIQEIENGNKMIMEFMGWPTSEVDDWGVSRSSTVEKTLIHRDWNLLMSVVSKISKDKLVYHANYWWTNIAAALIKADISEVYKLVTNAIEFHNKHSKNAKP